MARIASALFNDRTEAERAVAWLRDNGVPNDAITVIARNDGDADSWGKADNDRDASEGAAEAGSGMASGLGIGAGVGALFGLAAALIPGLGPLIVAGPLAAWLGGTAGTIAAGALVGGAAGGIAGALSHWGLSEAEAHHYAGEIERGGTYVGVDLDQANLPRETIFDGFRRYHGRVQDSNLDSGTVGTPMTAMAGSPGVGYGSEMARDYTEDVEAEARVPLVEEVVDVHKERRQAGEVNVTKRVETETQHISEPVVREQVTVDVRPVSGGTVDTNATLQPGETIRVPVYEEELVVDKRAEVTGEAVIRTQQQVEQVDRDIQLRRERVEVDEMGDVDVDASDDVATTTRRGSY